MFEIPIIISTPDCHPHNGEQYDEQEHGLLVSGSSPTEPHLPSRALHVNPITTSMVSEGTQTDVPDETPNSDSHTHSLTESPSSKSPFGGWTDHFHHLHISTPHQKTVPAESLLAPPGLDLPHRPMTPRADLYQGQTSDNFGMTFGARPVPHWRNYNKPIPCPNTYEDQKHKMMMNWLERRGSA